MSAVRLSWRGALAGVLLSSLLLGPLLPGALAFAADAPTPWEPPREGLQAVPPLAARVTDTSGTLTAAERQALEQKLAAWESRTTNQLVVLIVPTTKPETLEEYSLRVAEAWKAGHKGSDNGALFLIAKNDKRMRIEVGYGLEGSLTDVTSRRIIGDTVAPFFKQGQFGAGIEAGVDQIIKVVDSGEPLPASKQAVKKKSSGGGFDPWTLFIILLVVVPMIGGVLRSILGTAGGSIAGAGIAGVAAFFIAGSLLIAGVAAVVAFIVIIFSMFTGRGGGFLPGGFGGGGGGFGGGGGGGGFSGGGGSFGGGGASGGWD